MYSPSSSVLALVVGLFATASFLIYRATFPKPIPGIPYHEASAKRPFGDVQDLLAYKAKTNETLSFMAERCQELNSPICQVFARPFGKPWVVVNDSRESHDIMSRRTREFDRSTFFGDLFTTTLPHNQVQMRTGDQWRSNRRLMGDTMSPQFLQNVASPRIYSAFAELMQLWQKKMELADGRPFAAAKDVQEAMVEFIWRAAFGTPIGATKAQFENLQRYQKLDNVPSEKDAEVEMPRAKNPAAFEALNDLANSSEIPMSNPLGRTAHWIALNFYPPLRHARKVKDQFIEEKLHSAWQKFNRSEHDASDDDVLCAADLIVKREVALAKKEGREPQHDSVFTRDELFGFLVAGFDTTSTTTEWGLKFLLREQETQKKLREHLRQAYSEAAEEGRPPSAVDIAKTNTPYLDAFIEEVLRVGTTAPINIRVATEDAEVLGHIIPKGTDVFMPTTGPSYKSSPFDIQESKRSKTSRDMDTKPWSDQWDQTKLHEFQPERWINAKGEFDPRSGPMHTFGAGLRGCFGRRLAHLGLRTIFSLIVWHFDIQPVSEQMSGLEAMDMMTHRPQTVCLRLASAA